MILRFLLPNRLAMLKRMNEVFVVRFRRFVVERALVVVLERQAKKGTLLIEAIVHAEYTNVAFIFGSVG